jgi:uncharacterized protein (DUF1501 family)
MSTSKSEHDESIDSRRAVALGLLAAAGLLASQKAAAATNKKLVVCFQRFAADGLMELVPAGDALFSTLRPADCWPAGNLLSTGNPYWRLHPRLGDSVSGLGSAYSELWNKGQLALIPATCIPRDTRSHFTSQALLETADGTGTDIGFCSRALNISRGTDDPILRGVCLSDYVPDLARGDYDFLSIADPAAYRLTSRHANIQQPILSVYAGQTGTGHIAAKTALAIDQVKTQVAGISPAFAADEMGLAFKKAAQFLLANVGSQLITMDIGGWDMHANVQAGMEFKMQSLNNALVHFKTALGSLWADTTVVFLTEFGRTLVSNDSKGTDHGWGSLMMVAGGAVHGGIYGNWAGLGAGQAINAVPGLNDYRHALAEIFSKALGIPQLGYIFPNFTPSFWGIL